MIKCLLICDSQGYPFYSRTFDEFELIEPALLSGLISAIGTIGKQLFKQEIATITFGVGKTNASIVIVAKELFMEEKIVYFVFFTEQDCNHKHINEIATTIFIETKNMLKNPNMGSHIIRQKANAIIDNRFQGFNFC